jgi:hypothetical protein
LRGELIQLTFATPEADVRALTRRRVGSIPGGDPTEMLTAHHAGVLTEFTFLKRLMRRLHSGAKTAWVLVAAYFRYRQRSRRHLGT